MNPNIYQLTVGVTNAQKIGQELRSQTPFAAYDALSPDEPGLAAQLVKRLLQLPARFAKSSPTVRRQGDYSRSTESQSAPLFE